MFGNQTLIRIKSSTGDGAVARTRSLEKPVSAATGVPSSRLTESSLQSRVPGPLQPLSRYPGSVRNSAQSNPLCTTSRESPYGGCCPAGTTCNTDEALRRRGRGQGRAPSKWLPPRGIPMATRIPPRGPGSTFRGERFITLSLSTLPYKPGVCSTSDTSRI